MSQSEQEKIQDAARFQRNIETLKRAIRKIADDQGMNNAYLATCVERINKQDIVQQEENLFWDEYAGIFDSFSFDEVADSGEIPDSNTPILESPGEHCLRVYLCSLCGRRKDCDCFESIWQNSLFDFIDLVKNRRHVMNFSDGAHLAAYLALSLRNCIVNSVRLHCWSLKEISTQTQNKDGDFVMRDDLQKEITDYDYEMSVLAELERAFEEKQRTESEKLVSETFEKIVLKLTKAIKRHYETIMGLTDHDGLIDLLSKTHSDQKKVFAVIERCCKNRDNYDQHNSRLRNAIENFLKQFKEGY